MNEALKKRTTFRIDAGVKEGLEKLSNLLHKPQNQIVNIALAEFVSRKNIELEGQFESTLNDLRAYRKRDPHFEKAMKAFVEAEALAENDPAEGRIVVEKEETKMLIDKILSG